MYKTSLNRLLILVAGISMIASCKKYEEGPEFTLRTAKSRIVNSWVIEKYLVNGNDFTSFWLGVYGDYTIKYDKNNTYKFVRNGSYKTGKWFLKHNYSMLVIQESGVTGTSDYDYGKIRKLTNNEMWLLFKDGSDTIEIHYKAK